MPSTFISLSFGFLSFFVLTTYGQTLYPSSKGNKSTTTAIRKLDGQTSSPQPNLVSILCNYPSRVNMSVATRILDGMTGVDITCPNGRTPLLQAVATGNLDLVKTLKSRGANMQAKGGLNDAEDGAIHYAAYFGRVDMLRFLLNESSLLIEARNRNNDTPLCRAAHTNQLDAIDFLIGRSAKVEAICQFGRTALLVAAAKGNNDVIKRLLSKGAQLFVQSGEGDFYSYAIHLAAFTNRTETVKYLCEGKPDIINIPNGGEGNTALMGAAYFNLSAVVDQLLKCRANLEVTNHDGMTALHMAAVSGSVPITKMLVEAGADLFARTTSQHFNRFMPIHFAVIYGRYEVVGYFIGAQPLLAQALDSKNRTPSDIAYETFPDGPVLRNVITAIEGKSPSPSATNSPTTIAPTSTTDFY